MARWLLLLALALSPLQLAAKQTLDVQASVRGVFPEADTIGAFDGEPPAAGIYRDGQLLGYALLTDQIAPIPAYSGKPITTLVVFDLTGTIRGVRILRHEEPILVIGVKPADLERFVGQYAGLSISDRTKLGGSDREGYVTLDAISGATITTIVLNATIMRAVREVAESRGLLAPKQAPLAEGVAEPAQGALWEATWETRRTEVAGLLLGLGVLTFVLLFQDWLARRPRLLKNLRHGFLAFTVIYLGWYASAQLSVVNVLTFTGAVMHEFRWDAFLIDPILFILWGFVAVTLLLWGRGVYCGWLCPFGALQEFCYHVGRWLRLPQFELPGVVHDHLWALKYVIFILLFGLSLQALGTALPYAEVEPFKTVFSLHFLRDWPFVVYAVGLLLLATVNRKFFCKYLCPLGAALAIPANLKLFDWLRRRKECGRPCMTCAQECEVRAIQATGEINHHECHYCLDCQITYYNAHKCPPLVEKRKREERRQGRGKAPIPVTAVVKAHTDSDG